MGTKLTKAEREQIELGKKLQAFYEAGYVDKKQALGFSFLKGLASGIGGVIGATLVLALLLWILGSLNEVPLIGPITESIKTTIESK